MRYPRGNGIGAEIDKTKRCIQSVGSLSRLLMPLLQVRQRGEKVAVLAFGTMVKTAVTACQNLAETLPNDDVFVYNMRFVKPLDSELIDTLLAKTAPLLPLKNTKSWAVQCGQ